ncbi:MAG: alpha/beta fold hydrolase [Actinomycetia bacterium]|nr:alpha/beta fold hydrolase [Actinomycetes bacterium]MCP4959350.1 alpha/beta fold hydrolase [Actinomycetes bacterium]
MPHFTSGDVTIKYRIAGDPSARRVLYISGTGSDLRAPNLIRDRFEDHFCVASYDQRGLGRSSKPDRAYSMAEYAADAVAFMDHLGWSSASVFGISFGGMVAQELAVTWPGRIETLVLACTSSGGPGSSSFPLHTLVESGDEQRDAVESIERSDTRRDETWRSENPRLLAKLIDFVLTSKQIGAGEPGREVGARHQLEARAGHDTHDRLGHIDSACLVQGGRFDGIAPPENLKVLATQIPGATLKMYDGGHLFHLQAPEASEDAINFLSTQHGATDE